LEARKAVDWLTTLVTYYGWYVQKEDHPAGFLGAFVGAVIVLFIHSFTVPDSFGGAT
jgi:uncharacterized membrane protein YeaQ/YmgE (transglycosylase-associated protein family)